MCRYQWISKSVFSTINFKVMKFDKPVYYNWNRLGNL